MGVCAGGWCERTDNLNLPNRASENAVRCSKHVGFRIAVGMGIFLKFFTDADSHGVLRVHLYD